MRLLSKSTLVFALTVLFSVFMYGGWSAPSAADAALQYVGGASATGTAATYNVSLTALAGGIGSAAQTGDLVIVVTGWASGVDGNPGVTTPTGYTELFDLFSNDTRDANLSVNWKIMGGTPDTSVTVSGLNNAANGGATVVHVWRGADQSTPMDVAAVSAVSPNNAGDALPDSPAITPVTAGVYVLTVGLGTGAAAPTAFTAPAGYGNAVSVAGAGTLMGAIANIASIAWTSGPFDPGAWTGATSGSDSWNAATLAIRPAPVAGGINSCDGCHGNPPVDSPTRDAVAGTFVGSHDKHNTYACDTCHATLPAAYGHRTGKIEMKAAGTLGLSDNGTYNGGSVITQTNTPALASCDTINCHGNNNTGTWGTAYGTCTTTACHGFPPTNDNTHTTHYTAKGWLTGSYAFCFTCHPDVDYTTAHPNRTNGVIELGTLLTPNGSSPEITCSSISTTGCHNGAASTPAWNVTPGTITCTDCHTVGGTNSATVANPVSGLHGNSVVTVQDHDSSLGGCEVCHVKGSITYHWNGVASPTADYIAADVGITSAMYTDAGGAAATRGSCYGTSYLTSCHTDKGNWRRQWSTEADVDISVTKQPGQAVCNVCHGQYKSISNSTGWNEGTSHYRSSDLGDPRDEDKGIYHADASDECEDCHGYDSVAVHNSNNKIDFSDSGNPGGYAVTLNTTPNPDVWYCANCHNTQNSQIATETASHTFLDSLAFPNGTNPINHVVGTSTPEGFCYSCHGDGAAKYWPQNAGNARGGTTTADYNNAGAHQKHIEVLAARLGITLPGDDTQQKSMCAYCHVVNDGDHMTKAVGSYAEVFPAGGKKSLWNAVDSDAAFVNTSTYNCTTTDCHNNKNTTATYAWYSGATSTCIMCHTPGGATNDPTSGLHNAGTLTSSTPHDDAFGATGTCTTCHTAMPAIAPGSAHISGGFTANNDTATNEYYTLATMYTDSAQNSGSCSGATAGAAGCHSDGGAWGRKWSTTAYTIDGSSECANCHGDFTSGFVSGMSLRHQTTTSGDPNGGVANSHADAGGTLKCYICHGYGHASYTGGMHRDSNIQINSNVNVVDNGTTIGCTSCHSTNNVLTSDGNHGFEDVVQVYGRWTYVPFTGPVADCNSCHTSNGMTHASTNESLSVHTLHVDSTLLGVSVCTDCHTNAGSGADHNTGTVNFGNKLSGINYAKTGNFGGTCAASNGCHDSDAGEWYAGNLGGDSCADCHATAAGTMGANTGRLYPPTSAKHQKHRDNNWGVPNDCTDCHGTNAATGAHATHRNGAVDNTVSYVSLTQTCTNNCHIAATSGDWTAGGTLACADCHNASPKSLNQNGWPPVSNKHTQHVGAAANATAYGDTSNHTTAGAYEFGCGQCHGNTATNHVNGSVNITVTNWTAAAKTCGQNSCHNDGKATPGAPAVIADWDAASPAQTCNICHGNAPTTGAHSAHAVGIHYADIYTGTTGLAAAGTGTTNSHGSSTYSTTISCNLCHSLTVSTSRNRLGSQCTSCHSGDAVGTNITVANKSLHIDNRTTLVSFAATNVKSKAQLRNNLADAGLGTIWTRTGGYKVAGAYDVAASSLTAGTWNGTTCSNMSCHNNITATWQTPTNNCANCHVNLPR